jgi:hypothetical protein
MRTRVGSAGIWDGVKATLAVVALIAAALISADKLDREKASTVRGAAIVEPVVTGAIPLRR